MKCPWSLALLRLSAASLSTLDESRTLRRGSTMEPHPDLSASTSRPALSSFVLVPLGPSAHKQCLSSSQHHTQVKQVHSHLEGAYKALNQIR